MKRDILGVKVNNINLPQALNTVEDWINRGNGGRYIVTPNIEFIMKSRSDPQFREILNNADLAIPDSSRFGWSVKQLHTKKLSQKLLWWPFFLFPRFPGAGNFPVVTGVDLMEQIIKTASEKGYTIGLLGGKGYLAIKLSRILLKKYPSLRVTFASDGGVIDEDGNQISLPVSSISEGRRIPDAEYSIPPTDILFVAFGQVKQEKWIARNLGSYPVKVMMGVGGSFDYLAGEVKRAPKWLRFLGFEWFFRLILQPWRIKRFFELFKYVFLILTSG